jgi:hypothetical protein
LHSDRIETIVCAIRPFPSLAAGMELSLTGTTFTHSN